MEDNKSASLLDETELFWEQVYQDPAEAIKHLDCLILQEELDDHPEIKAKVYRYYSIYYSIIGELDSCESWLKKSYQFSTSIGNSKELLLLDNEYGVLMSEKGVYDSAVYYFLKVKNKSSEIHDTISICSSLGNLARVYKILKNFDQAEKCYKELLLLEKNNDTKDIYTSFLGYAALLKDLERHQEAQTYYIKALNMISKSNDSYNLAICYHGLGTNYDRLNKLDSAIYFWKKALVIYEDNNYNSGKSLLYSNIAYTYLVKKEVDSAINHGHKALNLSIGLQHIEAEKDAYNLLSEAYSEKKDFENALLFFKYYKVLEDSLAGIAIMNNVNELKEKYEYEENKKEIDVLTKQQKLQIEESKVRDLELKNKNYAIFILIVTLLLSILITALIVLKIRYKSITKEAKLKQQLLNAQMNPHFLFNSLNSIQRMYVEGNLDIANDYMSDFSHLLRNVLNNTTKDLIPLSKEIEILELYLNLEQIRADYQFDYNIIIHDSISLDSLHVPPMITQPFVENAIWHGILNIQQKGKISIEFYTDNKFIYSYIIDNGIGIDTKTKKNRKDSKGISLTKQRLGKDKFVIIESLAKGGTKVKLTIPIK